MKHLKCYLDTSIFNFILADNLPEKKNITVQLFKEIQGSQLDSFISDLVLLEIGRASEDKRTKLMKVIDSIKPISLEGNKEVDILTQEYLNAGLIPQKYRNDAIHIALAVVNNIDVIISWNMEHMVKLKTRLGVNGVNRLNGYKEIEICTPEEVLDL